MSEQNKKFIMQYLEAVSGKEKTKPLMRQYIEDEHLIQHALEMELAFPGYEIVPEDVIAEGDKVVVRGMVYASHEGDLMGIPPTGVKVSVPLMVIYRIVKGKIIQHWINADMLGLMQQLGAIPQTLE